MELTYRGTVYPWDCDHMGHMNVRHFVGKFDEATWQLFNIVSITSDYIKNNNRGMVAVEQNIIYKNEALPGDCISIFSEILEVKKKSIHFKHTMKDSTSELIYAETELTGVHIDTKKRKSCEFSPEMYQAIQGLICVC